MKFTDKILNVAISSPYGELAWKKEYVFQAIDELVDNGYAILGGDLWAVVTKDLNLSTLTQIDSERIAVGIIKGKYGKDYIYNWYSEKKTNESWDDYVVRTKIETIDSIEKMDAENTVAKEFENCIYYNLVFVDKKEFEKLKTNNG
jgi:hypothetical protein